jgi:hypothetical protein
MAINSRPSFLSRLFSLPMDRPRPFSAQGVSGTPVYAGYVLSPERSSKLIGMEKYRTFADIMTNVSIVAAGVRYFLNVIAKPTWSCEPADASSEAQQYADFLSEVLFDDLDTPWSRLVRRSGNYRFHGFAISEWIAKRRDDGKIGFQDVEWRPQWTIWRWDVDDKGKIQGAWQRDPLTGRQLGLPRGKIFYLVDDTLTDNPEGMGLLRHCVDPAMRLREYLDQEAIGFLRDLRGIPIGKAPLDELKRAVQNGDITQAQMDTAVNNLADFVQLEKKLKNTALVLNSQPYVNQTDSGLTVAGAPKWGIDLVTGQAPGLEAVAAAIVRINTEIARILGVEGLMLGSDSVGSHALSKDKSSTLYMLANSVLRDIRLQAQRDLVWPLWSLNGFPADKMPKLKSEDVSPRDVEQVARVLQQMAAAGSVLAPDDEAQNFVRDLLGAPHVDLERMAEMAEQQQAMQVASLQQAQDQPEDEEEGTAVSPKKAAEKEDKSKKVKKINPNHDDRGRFAPGPGGGVSSGSGMSLESGIYGHLFSTAVSAWAKEKNVKNALLIASAAVAKEMAKPEAIASIAADVMSGAMLHYTGSSTEWYEPMATAAQHLARKGEMSVREARTYVGKVIDGLLSSSAARRIASAAGRIKKADADADVAVLEWLRKCRQMLEYDKLFEEACKSLKE